MKHFQKAVELDPQLAQSHSNIGLVYVQRAEYDKALTAFEIAMQQDPDFEQAQKKFKQTKLLLSNIRQYETDLEKTPQNAGLLDKLATSYMYLGAASKAIQYWQQSLAIAPDNAEVLNNLAFIYVERKDSQFYDPDKALTYAEKACKLTKHQNPNFLDTLALVHANRGDFDQALGIAQQAMDIARSSNQEALADSIQKNISQYQKRSLP